VIRRDRAGRAILTKSATGRRPFWTTSRVASAQLAAGPLGSNGVPGRNPASHAYRSRAGRSTIGMQRLSTAPSFDMVSEQSSLGLLATFRSKLDGCKAVEGPRRNVIDYGAKTPPEYVRGGKGRDGDERRGENT
jgi:hypothetical protein